MTSPKYWMPLLLLTACPAESLPVGEVEGSSSGSPEEPGDDSDEGDDGDEGDDSEASECASDPAREISTTIEIRNMRDVAVFLDVAGCVPPFDILEADGEVIENSESNLCVLCPSSCDGPNLLKLPPGAVTTHRWMGQRIVPFSQPEGCQCGGMTCDVREELAEGDYGLRLRLTEEPCPDRPAEFCDCEAAPGEACDLLADPPPEFPADEVIMMTVPYPPVSDDPVVLVIE